ncbi:PREDICTED: uncharacterized protein LOC106748150 [Dinoponera quadriceps]|uniref:Uncharacterized protein LOC106748150 n=1 Tax=Dinoponera quadriceps TaxID=609295 RepID=A0A6P3XTP3_DINQU|nr:PREDICTED: uncharacterized protein LOC106748150 [Dinoponera quadriceps]
MHNNKYNTDVTINKSSASQDIYAFQKEVALQRLSTLALQQARKNVIFADDALAGENAIEETRKQSTNTFLQNLDKISKMEIMNETVDAESKNTVEADSRFDSLLERSRGEGFIKTNPHRNTVTGRKSIIFMPPGVPAALNAATQDAQHKSVIVIILASPRTVLPLTLHLHTYTGYLSIDDYLLYNVTSDIRLIIIQSSHTDEARNSGTPVEPLSIGSAHSRMKASVNIGVKSMQMDMPPTTSLTPLEAVAISCTLEEYLEKLATFGYVIQADVDPRWDDAFKTIDETYGVPDEPRIIFREDMGLLPLVPNASEKMQRDRCARHLRSSSSQTARDIYEMLEKKNIDIRYSANIHGSVIYERII